MLREMVAEEVGQFWLLYLSILVVVVETEVPTTCFKVLWILVWFTGLKAFFAVGITG